MELFGYDICFLNGFLKKLILRKKETKVGVETGSCLLYTSDAADDPEIV